jgi:hypothetical protein
MPHTLAPSRSKPKIHFRLDGVGAVDVISAWTRRLGYGGVDGEWCHGWEEADGGVVVVLAAARRLAILVCIRLGPLCLLAPL